MDRKLSRYELPEALHKWAVEEMRFQNDVPYKPLPTVQDFAEICKGEMAAIWKFVIQNIYSAQYVRKVRGNLLLKQKEAVPYIKAYRVKYGSGEHFSQKKADLYDRHRALIAEIKLAKTSLGQVEKVFTETHQELAEIEQTYQQTVSHVRDEQHKAVILRVHSEHIQREVDKLEEFSNRLDFVINNLKEQTGKSSKDARHPDCGATADVQLGIESSSTKDVRMCCQSVGTFLHEMLQGSYGTNSTHLGQHKNKLWTEVESVVSSYSPNQIMQSLLIIARQSAYSLRDKTSKIDIKKDAEKLRFKYSGGGQLSDLATQPSLLKSVHQLLEEYQTQQVKNFIETESYRNKIHRLQSRLNNAQKLKEETLSQYYTNEDQTTYKLAKDVFDTELQIAVTNAAINSLVAVRESLKEKISISHREKEMLYDKYQKIQGFQKMADGKQNLIRVLVKQNLNARTRLESQQAEIIRQARRTFDGQEDALLQLSEALKNSVKEEVDAFSLLSLPNLMFTVVDSAYWVAVVDLSINRLSPSKNTATSQMIKRILKAVDFPPYKAPEDLLLKVNELQCELDDLQSRTKASSFMSEYEKSCEQSQIALIERLTGLRKDLVEHDKKQIDEVVPLLQRHLTDLSEALTVCLQVKDLIQEWWEQPAQNTVPWIKVDDRSLQEWKDKWTVTVTQLRSLQFK